MSIKARLIDGAGYLVVRQAVGMLLSILGILVLARLLGPVAYGVYAASFAVTTYLYLVLPLGVSPLLMSESGELEPRRMGHAAALVFFLTTAGAVTSCIVVFIVDQFIPLGTFRYAFLAMAACLPIQGLGLVPTVLLERAVAYRQIAVVEAGNQLSQFAVSVGIALAFPNVWAPVLGFCAAILMTALALARFAPGGFRMCWEPAEMLRLARRSIPYAGSNWILQLRLVTAPVLVGAFLGPAAVGIVSLTLRIVTVVGFMREIIRRLSLSGMRHIAGRHERLRPILERLTEAQILVVGLPLIIVLIGLPYVVTFGFGPKWSEVEVIYPLVAFGFLLSTVSSLSGSALMVLHKNAPLIVSTSLQAAILALSIVVLTPRYGLIGYGIGELVSALPCLIVPWALGRIVGPIGYGRALLAGTVCGIALCAPFLGKAAYAPLILLAFLVPAWLPSIRARLVQKSVGSP